MDQTTRVKSKELKVLHGRSQTHEVEYETLTTTTRLSRTGDMELRSRQTELPQGMCRKTT